MAKSDRHLMECVLGIAEPMDELIVEIIVEVVEKNVDYGRRY